MIVSITGAGGFIGKALMVEHLERGDVVRVLRRPNSAHIFPECVEVYIGDLTDQGIDLTNFVKNADVLYHCAAEIRDKDRMQQVNVEGTSRLIQFASGHVKRWVQLSSVGAYGPVSEGVVTELSNEQPKGAYEETKTLADKYVLDAAKAGAFEAVILRPSIVYGESMSNQSIVQLMKMIERGWFFYIGAKGASANYVHVDDVVGALVLCAEHKQAAGETFNLSSWGTIEEMVNSLAAGLNCQPPIVRIPLWLISLGASIFGRVPKFPLTLARVKALTSRSKYSIEKIEQKLGFKLQISIEVGMKQLAQNWKLSD